MRKLLSTLLVAVALTACHQKQVDNRHIPIVHTPAPATSQTFSQNGYPQDTYTHLKAALLADGFKEILGGECSGGICEETFSKGKIGYYVEWDSTNDKLVYSGYRLLTEQELRDTRLHGQDISGQINAYMKKLDPGSESPTIP